MDNRKPKFNIELFSCKGSLGQIRPHLDVMEEPPPLIFCPTVAGGFHLQGPLMAHLEVGQQKGEKQNKKLSHLSQLPLNSLAGSCAEFPLSLAQN